jgi:hypothetical protein
MRGVAKAIELVPVSLSLKPDRPRCSRHGVAERRGCAGFAMLNESEGAGGTKALQAI